MRQIRVLIPVVLAAIVGFVVLRVQMRSGNQPDIQPETVVEPGPSQSGPIQGQAATSQKPVSPSVSGKTLFLVEQQGGTGIRFKHCSGTSDTKPFPSANGGGIAALDYDTDGLYDLYFATGTPIPIDPGQKEHSNRIYRNVGNWKFEDTTELARLGHNGFSAGLAAGDIDNDGFTDLYVTCFGKNYLFQNQGDGTFMRLPDSVGVSDERWSTSAAFLDYDDDGWLDIYVCNYAKWSVETQRWCGDRDLNIRTHCNPHSVEPEPDALFRNQGDGTFVEMTRQAGVGGHVGRGQGIVAADMNEDGRIDLYVGNDLNRNALFLNRADGTFHDGSEMSGAGFDYTGFAQAGMGVDVGDVDGDGRGELFVTNFRGEHNTLYANLGVDLDWQEKASTGEETDVATRTRLFEDVSKSRGVAGPSLPWVGWGTAFADLDLDGWLDLIVTNGHVDNNRELLGENTPYRQPALIWRNTRGSRFQSLGSQAGPYFSENRVGRGLVLSDLDNDGDQDVVIGHQDAEPVLLRNESVNARSTETWSVVLSLVGLDSNRSAVGSTVTLRTGDRRVVRQVKGGGSYLSANDLRLFLAIPAGTESPVCEIRWPGGRQTTLNGLTSGCVYTVVEPPLTVSQPRLTAEEDSG